MTAILDQATEAAAHWGGQVVQMLRNRENAVFEIALPDGRAALRLHRMGYQETASIRSELWWCAALAARGLPVATPLPARNGDLLVRLSNGRMASAIGWCEGEPLGEAGVPLAMPVADQTRLHHALGRLVAQVHSATDALTLPGDFQRPAWDLDGLVGEAPFWGRFWDHPAASPDQATTLRAARDFLRDGISAHAAAGGNYGPIHADLLRENILVMDGAISLIDFDDSGFGYRLYDLGTVLSQCLYEPAYSDIRAALIAGYATFRPVDAAMVDVFTLARTCASVGWAAPRLEPGHPVHASHLARAVMCANRVMD